MSLDKDKAKIDRFVEEVINKDKWEQVDEFVDPDAVDHVLPPGLPANVQGTKQFFTMFRAAFPDFKYTLRETLGEDDLIAQRVTCEGTMMGSFLGMPATGKRAEWEELHIVRLKNGRIVEHWGNVDQLSMLLQLGLASLPGGPQPPA